MIKTLLITPPFVQLNTPYPATGYLTRYLRSRGFAASQYDLSIDLFRSVFTAPFVKRLFETVSYGSLKEDSTALYTMRDDYTALIDTAISYLQGNDSSLTTRISRRDFFPEGQSFKRAEIEFEDYSGTDKARFYCTLFIQDLALFIRDEIDEDFALTKYAERISLSPPSFEPVKNKIINKNNIIIDLMLSLLDKKIAAEQPGLCAFTVPFPGNLISALMCSGYVKTNLMLPTVIGGGYVNTELRSINDPSFFEYTDYLTLDDGELPLERLIEKLSGKDQSLKRTFYLKNGTVVFENSKDPDPTHNQCGYPDYEGLDPNLYLDLVDTDNPVLRLWNEGRWNKLSIAHGCYWKKCAFCDTTLDYISRYKTITGSVLADRVELLISQTGITGFHFVDEAAPPKIMKEFAIEVLRRRLEISWWTNIRFENYFTGDICRLLAASGCIAVTGGLETASDRLLKLMNKGITVAGAANAARNFSDAGIMVHAYLIYGFPTQTEQETVDALETVKQLFGNGCIQSAYYHRYAMTAHSDTGRNPQKYRVSKKENQFRGFAENDLEHMDSTADHSRFSDGLAKAVFNYNRGTGFDLPVQSWFEFSAVKTSLKRNYISDLLNSEIRFDDNSTILNISSSFRISHNRLFVYDKSGTMTIPLDNSIADTLSDFLKKMSVNGGKSFTIKEIKSACITELQFIKIMKILLELNTSGIILFI